MSRLTISTRSDGAVTHVVLGGEFDLGGVEPFRQCLADVESAGPKAVLVDMSAVEFMDSSGLRALVMANERAVRTGVRLAIVPGPPQVRRVFEITHLDDQLELVEDPSVFRDG